MQIATIFFGEHITKDDIALDRYIGKDSIKRLVRSKRVGKNNPIRKFIEGPQFSHARTFIVCACLDTTAYKNDLCRQR